MIKKNIVILGSTGSIGKQTVNIIRKNKDLFSIKLLSTNTNVSLIYKQAIEFKVKNIIISDYSKYLLAKKIFKSKKISIYNNFNEINLILNNIKIEYSMVSIMGIDGLKPSIDLIKHSKNIAIVNKEALICGWPLIDKELKKYNTKFIPIDSEHFSIFTLLDKIDDKKSSKFYITASGGPFLNLPIKDFKKIDVKQALKHPNWKMGKKITIDSATLMNKVFEIIEAKNIFDLSYKNISILIHPSSYVHAIMILKNGLIKFCAHKPNMEIPIYNSMSNLDLKPLKKNTLKINLLNELNFQEVDSKKFPLINLLKNLPQKSSLYETILVTINDFFVYKFLEKKISFNQMVHLIGYHSDLNQFKKFKNKRVKNLKDIYDLRDYVSFKLSKLRI